MEFKINKFGIKTMIETSELLATSNGRDINDVPPTYTEMLITFYRTLDEQEKKQLRILYPITTKELNGYISRM